MASFQRSHARRIAILATTLLLALPVSGWTWGGATHHYIAQNYSKHLPPEIDGLRAYDSIVDLKVTDADTRKSYTPGESYRHYIDADWYPAFVAGNLNHSRAALEAQYGASTVLNNGIVPWAVDEVVNTLAQQFQAGLWSDAATTIADLCHYAGDATQPLHCTQNFDGQMTGNNGIHSRYETTMMSSHIADLHTSPMAVAYYPNVVDAMFGIVGGSWSDVNTVLQADNTAKAASGGSFNTTYYNSLWNSTQSLTRARIDSATVATASFVYTAWIKAGRPPVPGSTVSVPAGSVAGAHLDVGPTPFRDALTIRFAGSGPLSVDVFDVHGSRVERLVDRAYGAGSVSWRPNGRTRPGLYFVRLTGLGQTVVRRVARLK